MYIIMHGFKPFLLGILPFLFVITQARVTPIPWHTPNDLYSDHNKEKLEVLLGTVKSILKYTADDITIIASEDIHNDDGSIKEIKTIELIIPNPYALGHRNGKPEYLEELTKLDEDFDDALVKTQKVFKKIFDEHGYQHQVAYQRLLSGGSVDLEVYVNKDAVFVQESDDMGYFTRDNIRVNDKNFVRQKAEEVFETSPNGTLISALLWDEQGTFQGNDSKVETKLLAYVDEASDNADEKMLDCTLQALTQCALNHPGTIAKELSSAMSKSYPDYNWFVTKWQDDNVKNAKHDVFIKATYDNVRPGESLEMYSIYGAMK